jgi:hypothetical protein
MLAVLMSEVKEDDQVDGFIPYLVEGCFCLVERKNKLQAFWSNCSWVVQKKKGKKPATFTTWTSQVGWDLSNRNTGLNYDFCVLFSPADAWLRDFLSPPSFVIFRLSKLIWKNLSRF